MASEGSLPTLDIAAHVATLTLQRPDVANRLGPDDLQALLQHIETVNGSDVRVLVLRSTGKYFCSGFDIGKLAAGQRGAGFEPLVNAMEDCRAVTIAEIQGGVYGGGTDLSLACDFRLGTDAVEMFMPAARLGLATLPAVRDPQALADLPRQMIFPGQGLQGVGTSTNQNFE